MLRLSIAKQFFKVLPLIKASGAISISPDSIFLSILSAQKVHITRHKAVSNMDQLFLSYLQVKNRVSLQLPLLVLIKLLVQFFSINKLTATETAKKLFPVPAGPKDITISFSFNALIYSDCFSDLAITDFLGVLINCLNDFTFDSSNSIFFFH